MQITGAQTAHNCMNTSSDKKILLIGIGNTLRSDDGVGAYICGKIGELAIPGLTIMVVQQLLVELVEDLVNYDHVLLVDAAVNSSSVHFEPLETNSQMPVSSSHHVNASVLQALVSKLYNKSLSLHLCTIPGYDFNTGDQLSSQTKEAAADALALITDWLKKKTNLE